MRTGLEKVKIVFRSDLIDATTVFSEIRKQIAMLNLPELFIYRGNKVHIKKFEKMITTKGIWGGGLFFHGLEFQYTGVYGRNLRILQIAEVGKPSVDDWDFWVESFLGKEGFIQAWISDINYDYWQNATDPLEYSSQGREYFHLPMKSNNLSYPLEQMVIDTSNNPGRWNFINDYVEAIGSTMWLGELFWSLVGVEHKNDILSENLISKKILENGVIKLVASDHTFSDNSNAEIQDLLRKRLYG